MNKTLHNSTVGNMPEDVFPNTLYEKDGFLVSPLCYIGYTKSDFLSNNVIVSRRISTNVGGFVWTDGHFPKFWKLK